MNDRGCIPIKLYLQKQVESQNWPMAIGCQSLHFFFYFVFVLFLRKRESVREYAVGEGQRDRIPSRLRTVHTEPDSGLDLTNCDVGLSQRQELDA